MALVLRDSDETYVIEQLLQAQTAIYITFGTLTVRYFTLIPDLLGAQRPPGCDMGLDPYPGRGMSHSQRTWRKLPCFCLLSGTDQRYDGMRFDFGILHGSSTR